MKRDLEEECGSFTDSLKENIPQIRAICVRGRESTPVYGSKAFQAGIIGVMKGTRGKQHVELLCLMV